MKFVALERVPSTATYLESAHTVPEEYDAEIIAERLNVVYPERGCLWKVVSIEKVTWREQYKEIFLKAAKHQMFTYLNGQLVRIEDNGGEYILIRKLEWRIENGTNQYLL